jgi:hypothetical protein
MKRLNRGFLILPSDTEEVKSHRVAYTSDFEAKNMLPFNFDALKGLKG